MSRYIDADKLIAEIDRRMTENCKLAEKAKCFGDRAVEDNDILALIERYQQEQPKFKIGDTIHKIGENTVFPMTIERISDGDYVCVTEHQKSFINIKFQDDYELVGQGKTEVDLEKEIDLEWKKCKPTDEGMGLEFANIVNEQFDDIAHHFYKLGLNARKKE